MVILLPAAEFEQLPEWAPQRAVWMSWSTYDPKRGVSVHAVQRRIAQALAPNVRVEMLAQDPTAARRGLAGISNVQVRRGPGAEMWVRDTGPAFLNGPQRARAAGIYGFDFWGYDKVGGELAAPEDAVDLAVARMLQRPVRKSQLVSEGGNREVDGLGTLMMTAEVEERRNPGWTRAAMAAEHQRVLGQTQTLWLEQGVAEDDLTFDGPLRGPKGDVYTLVTTGGHIDNIARFAPNNTILLAEVTEEDALRDPIAAESRRRLERNAAILRQARNALGEPYRVVRMPSPDPIYVTIRPGDTVYDYIAGLAYKRKPFPKGRPVTGVLAASYMNYLVSNGVIVTSTFAAPGRPAALTEKDRQSLAVLKRVFPGHRIVALDTTALNLGGGGVHCISLQEAR
jgi:agmatine deiminase